MRIAPGLARTDDQLATIFKRWRDGWTDIGGDRFTQGNQNKMIESMSYFTYPAAYTQGNVGARTMDAQRFIDNQFSASKEWKVKER